MNDITITADKLSRINKRLYKALKEEIQKEEPSLNLSQTGELLAKALGLRNTHHLQQTLQHQAEMTSSSLSSEDQLIQNIEQLISDHLSKKPDHRFLGWAWTHHAHQPSTFCLTFHWKRPIQTRTSDSVDHWQEASAMIFMSGVGAESQRRVISRIENQWGYPFKKEQRGLHLDHDIEQQFTPDDWKLLTAICELVPFDNKKQLVLLNHALSEYTKCQAGQSYEIFRHDLKLKNFDQVVGYYMEPEYLLLPENFEEDANLKKCTNPYYWSNNTTYWCMPYPPNALVYSSFEQAQQYLQDGMVIAVHEKITNRDEFEQGFLFSYVIKIKNDTVSFRHAAWNQDMVFKNVLGGIEEQQLFMRWVDHLNNYMDHVRHKSFDEYPVNSYYHALFQRFQHRLAHFYEHDYQKLTEPLASALSCKTKLNFR